jgi:hypothetical protein
MTNLLHATENDQKTQEQGTIVERDVAINNDATCSQCERCRIASIPCVVSSSTGRFKQVKCDGCTNSNAMCYFTPPMFGISPLKLPKTCIHCQAAHQTCVLGKADLKCLRCTTSNLVCAFAPCAQGSRADLKRILTTPPEISKM